jgi:hypothetical protein
MSLMGRRAAEARVACGDVRRFLRQRCFFCQKQSQKFENIFTNIYEFSSDDIMPAGIYPDETSTKTKG